MLIEVKVPQLSESVSEASLVTWHKKEGEAVKRDENLVDIETDKTLRAQEKIDQGFDKLQKGIEIARRTVTKYREAMGLPAASQRKAQAILRGQDESFRLDR